MCPETCFMKVSLDLKLNWYGMHQGYLQLLRQLFIFENYSASGGAYFFHSGIRPTFFLVLYILFQGNMEKREAPLQREDKQAGNDLMPITNNSSKITCIYYSVSYLSNYISLHKQNNLDSST